MRPIILFVCFLAYTFSALFGQLEEDFSDGDLLQNPSWFGNTDLFIVNDEGKLQSQGPAASTTLFLSTENTLAEGCTWTFTVSYPFAPSTSNQVRIYLLSDNPDLSAPLNGYYIALGESGSQDGIDLYRQTGSTRRKILDGLPATIADSISASIQVRRDLAGNWEIWSDVVSRDRLELLSSGSDNTFTTSTHFGLWVKHSSTRGDAFQFDDINIEQTEVPIPPRLPSFREIRITEFLPDPNPVRGLPEAEFYELHNLSDTTFNLEGWTLNNGTTLSTLPEYQFFPGEYVILTRNSDVAAYSGFGEVIGVSRFPALVNARDNIGLRSSEGILVDTLNYNTSWYEDTEKARGGISLEVIDPQDIQATDICNWNGSNDPRGGTPGATNSANSRALDTKAPSVNALTLADEMLISLSFSEPIQEEGLLETGNYMLDKGVGEPFLVELNNETSSQISLLLSRPLDQGEIYTLRIANLLDCSGNILNDTLLLGIPQTIEANDILINEILFNPYVGGADFVEIMNVSNKIFDLKDLEIAEIEEGELKNVKTVSPNGFLFLPGEILCLTKDVSFQKMIYSPPARANFLAMPSFPSYADNVGECLLLSQGRTIDQFAYLDDYHVPEFQDEEGVSLERISTSVATSVVDNWRSSASQNEHATPGYENSQREFEGNISSISLYLAKETFSPNDDGVDDALILNIGEGAGGNIAKISVFDRQGKLVRALKNRILLGNNASMILWDGREDSGAKAAIGVYVVFVEVINELGDRERFRFLCVLADYL